MSLDVELIVQTPITHKGTGVFVRRDGRNVELTPEEVASKWPGSHVEEREYETKVVFDANITHNLGEMADEAGIYQACWRPEDIGAVYANDIIELLSKGYENLLSNPKHYKKFDAENGWGTYEQFVPWVRDYLAACRNDPEAEIRVDR